MAYKQGGNPLSRKSSPLNARNPFKRVSPLNMKAEDETPHRKMDDETKAKHKAEMHNKGGDPDEAMREEDLGQQANQPTNEQAIERRSSKSPLNKHDEWQSKIDAARAKWEKEKPEGDFYEVHADLFKKQEEAKKAHKDEGPSRKSSSPINKKCNPETHEFIDGKCVPKRIKKKKGEIDGKRELGKTGGPLRKSSSPLNTHEPGHEEEPKSPDKVEKVGEDIKGKESGKVTVEGEGASGKEDIVEVEKKEPKKDTSRKGIKKEKSKAKEAGESKRDIRTKKTKSKAEGAREQANKSKNADRQMQLRAKAKRLDKRAKRQEGRKARKKIRKDKTKSREDKKTEITASREKQKK